jgi:hypothetical protein
VNGPRRVGLSCYATFVALSAFAGAAGLATGGLALGGKLDHRLPFHSPVFGAVALALVVGLPSTALARDAWRGDRTLGITALLAGIALVGWIAVELAFIREFSWLQPFYAGVGVTYVAIGRHAARRLQPQAARS